MLMYKTVRFECKKMPHRHSCRFHFTLPGFHPRTEDSSHQPSPAFEENPTRRRCRIPESNSARIQPRIYMASPYTRKSERMRDFDSIIRIQKLIKTLKMSAQFRSTIHNHTPPSHPLGL
ncbi:hypothetical protein L1049_025322 [Liquidambar formosana]|uniref:Uncharacterized protein n=1 Tax=Liquidambar formosana TaxID=63359 RepID=A0AAP0N293_LIQFO